MKTYYLECTQCQMRLQVAAEDTHEASQIISKKGWVVTKDNRPSAEKIAEHIKAFQSGSRIPIQSLCPAHNPSQKRMWAPPRFRSLEDAIACTRAMNEGGGIPQDRMVLAYKQLPNGDSIINPEWGFCPLEVYYSIVPAKTIENVSGQTNP